jgi:hypothetical protein
MIFRIMGAKISFVENDVGTCLARNIRELIVEVCPRAKEANASTGSDF